MANKFVDEFSKNFLPKPQKKTLRHIGIELEFPVAQDNGEAVDYQTIRKMFDWLESKGWKTTIDPGTGEKVEAELRLNCREVKSDYDSVVISTDVGYCTVEVALIPHDNLLALEEHWEYIKTILLEFFAKENCRMLGYGVQPLSRPQHRLVANKSRYAFFEQDSLNRFIDQKNGKDLSVFAVSASNQCHIDVYKDEAIVAVNVVNGLAPLLSAVTANSPVWGGTEDPEWLDVREIFWDRGWSNRIEQIGIPEVFKDFSDYVDRLCQFRPLMINRNGEYIKILDVKTFGDFLNSKEGCKGQKVNGELLKLHSRPEDILLQSGFAWWQVRLAPAYGTLEVRPCSQQPDNATLSVAALALGLVENLPEASKLYSQYALQDWRTLRFDVLRHGLKATMQGKPVSDLVKQALGIARGGLRARSLGEEKFLDVLDARVQNMLTVADEVKRVFNRDDLQPFFDLVEIRRNA